MKTPDGVRRKLHSFEKLRLQGFLSRIEIRLRSGQFAFIQIGVIEFPRQTGESSVAMSSDVFDDALHLRHDLRQVRLGAVDKPAAVGG
jgi:hypothetical protein